MQRHRLAAAAAIVLAGVAAGLVAMGARRPAPLPGELDIATSPLLLERSVHEPLLVTPDKWLELPMLRGDFDLLADLELGDGAEAFLIVRRVEPRPLRNLNLGFHGRFACLRLSSTTAGQEWCSPTEALFGEPGGVKLGAGIPATIALQARGRDLEANVAGKRLPVYAAQDDHGSLAIIAKGGNVAVQRLRVQPVVASAGLPPWLLGGLCGLAVAAFAVQRRASMGRCLFAVSAWLGASAIVCEFSFAALQPLAQPDRVDELLAVAAGVPLALAMLVRGRVAPFAIVVGLAAATWSAGAVARAVDTRFPPTLELDSWLGPQSRETVIELLARRLRGPQAIHTPTPSPHRVMLLGGQLLYARGAAPDQHVEVLLGNELRSSVPDADVVGLPTVDGWSAQQWRLFERFLTDYRPLVVVLGVPRDEAAIDPLTETPRSTPELLRATIASAASWCAAHGARLVLLRDDGVPDAFAGELQKAREGGVPLVEINASDAAVGVARKLAAAIKPLLQ